MKNKKKIIFKMLLVLILIFLFLKIFFLKGSSNIRKNDDFLFLKLFSNGEILSKDITNSESKKIYNFKIDYKNLDFKSIDLADTIDKETLIYDKIAPGTSGSFNILLNSNQNLKYKIEINSMNEKPYNLKFEALKNGELLVKTNTLEELSEKLTGYINKDEKIDFTINWYWNYEGDTEISDIQDTKDAENIKRYQFNLYTLGEEIL